MPGTDLLLAFVLAACVFAYMPGPSTLYAAARTIAGGRRAGWFAALGIHLGGYVHVLGAAFGLAILFQVVPVLYVMLKVAGALYLIWLGLSMFRAQGFGDAPVFDNHKTPRRAFWESVTVEVLNPKTALFYVAFLPQFTDPGAAWPVWAQLLILGTIVNLMFSSADVICVVLAEKIAGLLRTSASASKLAQRIGGGILVGLGLNLAFNRS